MDGDTVKTTCDITKLLCELCLHPIISDCVCESERFKSTVFHYHTIHAMIYVRILSHDRRLIG